MTGRGPYKIGLTGSIGMGKSTVSAMFADAGAAVWDADGAVHRLYQPEQAGFAAIQSLSPDAATPDGVDRKILSSQIAADPGLLPRIEAAIHPLVARDRAAFLANCTSDIAVLDIPLLFETGDPADFDMIAVVSAGTETQRARVLARPGMTAEKFDMILSKQMPDREKRARADVVIPTDVPLEETAKIVTSLVTSIRETVS